MRPDLASTLLLALAPLACGGATRSAPSDASPATATEAGGPSMSTPDATGTGPDAMGPDATSLDGTGPDGTEAAATTVAPDDATTTPAEAATTPDDATTTPADAAAESDSPVTSSSPADAADAAPLDSGPCADTNSDPHNCGACGHDCLGGGCSAGACTPLALATPNDAFPQGIAVDSAQVYWTESGGNVTSVPIDGGASTVLATEPQGPTAIAVQDGTLYWVSQAGTLRRLHLGDAMPATLASFAGSAFGLALDSRDIYWTADTNPDGGPGGAVMTIPVAGGNPVVMIDSLNVPEAIAISPADVYWLDVNTNVPQGPTSLLELPRDGGALLSPPEPDGGQFSGSGGIATDATYVYFATDGSLLRMPLAGGSAVLLASALGAVVDLAVDSSGVYVLVDSAVLKVPLAGGVAVPLVQQLQFPRALALDARAIYYTQADLVSKLAK